jgi:hypothetical protein
MKAEGTVRAPTCFRCVGTFLFSLCLAHLPKPPENTLPYPSAAVAQRKFSEKVISRYFLVFALVHLVTLMQTFVSNSLFLFLLLQDLDSATSSSSRRMDRLRRSLRSSLRRKKDHSRRNESGSGNEGGGNEEQRHCGSGAGGQNQWQMDEVSVRSGTCSFQVKVGNKFRKDCLDSNTRGATWTHTRS